MTQAELSKKIGLSETSISRHLKHLLNAGLVQKIGSERKWKYYEITPKGIAVIKPEKPFSFKLLLAVLLIGILLVFTFTQSSQVRKTINQAITQISEILSNQVKVVKVTTTTTTLSENASRANFTSLPPAPLPSPTTTALPPAPVISPTPTFTFPPSTTTLPPVNNFSFSIIPTPPSNSTTQGLGSSAGITVSLESGTAQLTYLSYSNCPPLSSCTITDASGYPPFNSFLKITTSSNTPPGFYPILIQGNSSNSISYAYYNLTILSPLFDFNLALNPSGDSITAGNSSITTLTAALLNGNNTQLSYSYSNCPQNANCSFSSNTTSSTASNQFTANTSTLTPAGNYQITLTATGGGVSKQVVYNLTISGLPAIFDYSLSPFSTQSIYPGDNLSLTAYINLTSGTSQQVSLSNAGCPTNGNCFFSNASGFPNFTDLFLIQTTPSTPPGAYNITINANGGGKAKASGFTLNVLQNPFDYNITVLTPSSSVQAGNSTSTQVRAYLVNGSTQLVTLTYSGCPASANCSYAIGRGDPTFTDTFEVSTTNSTPRGNYIITLNGTASGFARQGTYNLTVS